MSRICWMAFLCCTLQWLLRSIIDLVGVVNKQCCGCRTTRGGKAAGEYVGIWECLSISGNTACLLKCCWRAWARARPWCQSPSGLFHFPVVLQALASLSISRETKQSLQTPRAFSSDARSSEVSRAIFVASGMQQLGHPREPELLQHC